MSDSSIINICFHGVGSPERELEEGEAPYWISKDNFERILDVVVNQSQVRLSFDDGNLSDFTTGMPALLDRDLTATFFVLAGRLDGPGSLAAEHLRELTRNGMSVGSHGMDHQPWPGLDRPRRDRELIEARLMLADVVGAAVNEAALPLGRYDRHLLRDLRRLGYVKAYTSDRCRARTGSWLQPRFSVRADDTAESVINTMLRQAGLLDRTRLAGVRLVKRLR